MGWKLSLIAARQPTLADSDALAVTLGFPDFREEQPLDRVLYPAPGLAIGHRNGVTLLSSESLTEAILADESCPRAKNLYQAFPAEEYFVASLHSVVDYYAFCLLRGGKVVRRRVGCADEGTMQSDGEPLVWESEHEEEVDGWKHYDGEGAVFQFLEPLLGFRLDYADDEFYAHPFRVYQRRSKGFFARLFGR